MQDYPVIQKFNDLAIKLIKSIPSGSPDPDSLRGDTGDIARTMAMLNVAMFDAVTNVVNNGEAKYKPIVVEDEAPAGSDALYAAASAGKTILTALFSTDPRRKMIADTYAEFKDNVGPVDGSVDGSTYGYSVAGQLLAQRTFDVPATGANATARDGGFNSSWRSQYAQMKPFVLESPGHVNAPPPPPSGSQRYSEALNEVVRIGERSSSTRNGTSTSAARAWNGGGNTSRPSGAWFEIALSLTEVNDRSLLEYARLFSLLGMAICDAMITSWHIKSTYDYWRPAAAIRNAHLDGNDKTCRDLSWVQLSGSIGGSPEYTSGTATFAGAASTVLTNFFGTDAKDFTIHLQKDIRNTTSEPSSYTSFQAAAEEAAMSRLYNGIHFRFSSDVGMSTGKEVGDLVMKRHYA